MTEMLPNLPNWLTRDWHDIPAGYYAIPVYDRDDQDNPIPDSVLAYRTFRRTVARTTKTGKRIGEDRFITGAVMYRPDADADRVHKELATIREIDREIYGRDGSELAAADDILTDLDERDTFRANYGKFTGRCGCCHKRLTDPESKLRGIGPECRGDRKH